MSPRSRGGRHSAEGTDIRQSDALETGVSRSVSSLGEDLGSLVDPLTSVRLLQPALYLFGHRLGCKSEILLDVLVRRGSAVSVPADHEPLRTDHAPPRIAASDLDDDALRSLRQNLIAVGARLAD